MSRTGISRKSGWGRATGLAKGLMLGAVMVVIAACSPVYRNHGYVPSDEELALIEVGKDNRDTVAATLGRPSGEGLLNDVGWFYVQSRWKHSGALEPKEIDRQVVSITFTEAGIVENVERFGLEDGKVVAISRRVTTSNIKGVGFLKQLLGNIGRLRADQFID
ncbi:MAG: outer membrane protein assembly factor BamE [Brevundimonas sp.]|jgi:outer membrane protein assembly factor BamE (lipoprotein component of BamABCDE complex)|uniref:outer membrane protein assembly factor BamE n=1 Tax=Brevundimonas sp. TaxID=1871086 RepID=UPI002735339E|nr:outer membrane protein assembly factor BamE [Brevundimonas sp.]MDP3378414.1 outer membrane protein assembly factor BamE [Brevundimonas sp.]